jgi:DNA-directed RNA polymerase subunit alpha
MDVGTIALDAIFSPIRRVSYEVENMRVGDNTNHNRLRITIETDGTLTPEEALIQSVSTMMLQLQAISGIDYNVKKEEAEEESEDKTEEKEEEKKSEDLSDVMKTRIDTLDLSSRTLNSLTDAGIRTVGGIARKKKEDLLEIEGIGEKGIQEIKKILSNFGITLK